MAKTETQVFTVQVIWEGQATLFLDVFIPFWAEGKGVGGRYTQNSVTRSWQGS